MMRVGEVVEAKASGKRPTLPSDTADQLDAASLTACVSRVVWLTLGTRC